MSLSHPPLEEQQQQQHSLTYTTRGSLSFHSTPLTGTASSHSPIQSQRQSQSSGSIRSCVAVVDS